MRREIMNLKKVEKNLTDLLNKKMGLDFKYKTEDGLLVASCDLKVYDRERPAICTLWIFEAGTAIFSFLFDKIPYTALTLDTAAKFNSEVTFLKATVTSGMLNILHEAYIVEEKSLPDYVKGILGVLVSQDVKNYLEGLLLLCDSNPENNPEVAS